MRSTTVFGLSGCGALMKVEIMVCVAASHFRNRSGGSGNDESSSGCSYSSCIIPRFVFIHLQSALSVTRSDTVAHFFGSVTSPPLCIMSRSIWYKFHRSFLSPSDISSQYSHHVFGLSGSPHIGTFLWIYRLTA